MCFIDSPISRCEAVREMVLTDQTQAECAREHECPPGRHCPLDGCFADMSGVTETAVIAEVAAAEAAHHVTREEASSPWPTEPSAPVKSSSSAGPERGPDKLAA
ncbi:hypothetical protein [Zoogloea sp.]|jgi:hypothetical protein|uniref:hypothetical protein n=1 Tax=Zoogloea sp. TaxID=49181 RepID=UPI0035B0DA8F